MALPPNRGPTVSKPDATLEIICILHQRRIAIILLIGYLSQHAQQQLCCEHLTHTGRDPQLRPNTSIIAFSKYNM